jgi:hypothetical protein
LRPRLGGDVDGKRDWLWLESVEHVAVREQGARKAW